MLGDAGAAQLNSLGAIAGFENCTYFICFLMCCTMFRKRIRHLPALLRGVVYRGILDMHYTLSKDQLISGSGRVSQEWQEDNRLLSFVNYFYTQWFSSRFWRWQIYYSPGGFVTTNTPCEVF